MRTVVLDTNVLLVDPEALSSYPNDEIILPEIVLSELDKIKVSRTDADTRYKGREISRLLFELADGKSLVDGVDLPNGGRLRIVPFDTDKPMPEGFAAKNPDDRVIVTAFNLANSAHAAGDDVEVLLITNDLNMLLKAQTLGVPIKRHDGGDESSFTKKYLVRPFQKYRTPLLILAFALAVFAATIIIAINMPRPEKDTLPSEYRTFLTEQQADGIDALIVLQTKPTDAEALLSVATLYYDSYEKAVIEGSADAISYAKRGVEYYTRYLKVVSTDSDARVNMAILQFYTGETDKAISALQEALVTNPNHIRGNYNMGVVYMQGRHDYENAAICFQKVIELCGDDESNASLKSSSQSFLNQIELEKTNLSDPSADGVVL